MKTVNIKGTVISDDYKAMYDWFEMDSVSPNDVSNVLNDTDNNQDDVTVNVNSNGGDVFAASEIYTLLKSYPSQVTVNIQSIAASAASVIAMAGDHVNISPTAHIMIHKAMTSFDGNSDDLHKEADTLSKIDQSISNAYVSKTGMKQSELLQLMSNETWLTAQEAVDKGFADEIMFANKDNELVLNSSFTPPKLSKFNELINNQHKTIKPADTLLQRKLAILNSKNGKEDDNEY